MAISEETRLLKMLEQDKTKYCWVDGEIAGEPQSSIKDAIEDYLEYISDYSDIDSSNYVGNYSTFEKVYIGHPSYYAADINGEQVTWQVADDANSDLEGHCYSYLDSVEYEHLEELSKELSDVFRKWEKRHGYECNQYIVEEIKPYRIGDYVKEK